MSYPCQYKNISSCNYVAFSGPDLMTHHTVVHGNFLMYGTENFLMVSNQVSNKSVMYGSQYNSIPSTSSEVAPNRPPEVKSKIENKSTDDVLAKYPCEHCNKKFRHKGKKLANNKKSSFIL